MLTAPRHDVAGGGRGGRGRRLRGALLLPGAGLRSGLGAAQRESDLRLHSLRKLSALEIVSKQNCVPRIQFKLS